MLMIMLMVIMIVMVVQSEGIGCRMRAETEAASAALQPTRGAKVEEDGNNGLGLNAGDKERENRG